MKSSQDIKGDIYEIVVNSDLGHAINGEVRTRNRARNSKKEDVIISVLANMNGQVQKATVNVNIYVPDYDEQDDTTENGLRIGVLSDIASRLFDVYHGDSFRCALLSQNIFEAEGCHIINNQIEYKQVNE